MIFVTVGTHTAPFDRLVRAASTLADLDTVVVQRGNSLEQPEGCRFEDAMSPEQWQHHVETASVVVTHGGTGSIFAALAHGVPLVVPRRRLWCEHVDDHQVAFAQHLGDRVRVVHNVDGLRDAVMQALEQQRQPATLRDPDELCRSFDRLIRDLVP